MVSGALGKRPVLAWIDKTLLRIDASYQRTLSAKRSQQLIAKLAEGFCWAHCAPLIAAKGEDETYTLIDGQHRHQAALRRDDIKDLPCYVIDAVDRRQQVAAFIAHNRDRVALTSVALFHAAAAQGDFAADGVMAGCAAAGVTIPKTPLSIDKMPPHATIATGAMTRIVQDSGKDALADVLKMIREAHPTTPGQLRSHTIAAVATMRRLALAKRAEIVAALASTTGQKLEDAARALRGDGVSIAEAFIVALTDMTGRDGRAVLQVVAKDRQARTVAKSRAYQAAHAAKKKRKAFRFDRSAPAAAAAAPVDVRRDVKVRRFEAGTLEQLIVRTFAASGIKVETYYDRAVKKWRYRGELLSESEILAKANALRAKRGQEPLGDTAKGRAP